MKWIVGVLCLIGFVVASISLFYHYADASESFCNINDKFNCQTVYQSKYSYVFGIPVPILGILAYAGFAVLAYAEKPLQRALAFSRKDYWWYLALFASFMLVFQLVMTGISMFLIRSFCILCMISQLSVLGIAIVTWALWRRQ